MVFNYKEVTVSGTSPGVEGVSRFIQEAKTFLEGAGWTTVDDRSAQNGDNDSSLTHKIVFSSKGEAGTAPTFYLTIFSGSNASAASSQAYFLVHTAYDVSAHQVPASGVSNSATHTQSNATPLAIRSTDSNSEIWMSGDADAVTFVVKRSSNATYDSATVGKFKSFYTQQEEPYGLFIHSSNTVGLHLAGTANLQGVSGNPPRRFDATGTSAGTLQTTAIGPLTSSQPYNLGVATSIFQASPLLVVITNNGQAIKGVLGVLPTSWEGVGTSQGLLNEGYLTASGVDFGTRIYRVFATTTASLIIRKT